MRNVASARPADTGFGKGRHAVMTGCRRLQHREGERRTRALAEAHAEIKERTLTDPLDEATMTRLGRDMPDHAMIERMRVGGVQHRSSGGGYEAVEHDRYPPEPRRHDRPGDGRKFEPAQPA